MVNIILAGGSGTRLWPLSRMSHPKQFIPITTGSLFQQTVRRLSAHSELFVIAHKSYGSMIREQIHQLNRKNYNLLLEPQAKNTAAAIAWAVHQLQEKGLGDSVVGIFPSDHWVAENAAFKKALRSAEQLANKGQIVIFGIKPTFASTEYGYIQLGSQIKDQLNMSYDVKRFIEKPDATKALRYMRSGEHLWNSGMFVARVDNLAQHFANYQPGLWQSIAKIDKRKKRSLESVYKQLPAISFDVAIMEKLKKNVVCIKAPFTWSDVGTWDEFLRFIQYQSNHKKTNRGREQSYVLRRIEQNHILGTQKKLIGIVGVNDLIVVDTDDALLITKKGNAKEFKLWVEQNKKKWQQYF